MFKIEFSHVEGSYNINNGPLVVTVIASCNDNTVNLNEYGIAISKDNKI
jgi:hypothetical protein